jgi:hypothetical protein
MDGVISSFEAFLPLPGVSGQSRSLDTVNGNVAVVARQLWPFEADFDISFIAGPGGFTVPGGFQVSRRAERETGASGESATGSKSSDESFGEPTVDEPAIDKNGDVAFREIDSNGGGEGPIFSGIYLSTGSSNDFVASTGLTAFDSTGIEVGYFARFGHPVLNNNGAVAFIADLQPLVYGARDQLGIFSNAGGTLVNLALEGSAAPGGGAFSSFNEIVLPDTGDLVFEATLSGEPPSRNEGVWALWNGELTRVVGKGDSLDLRAPAKTVKSVVIFQLVPTALGQSRSFDATTGNLVFEATFTDGTWGIYEATAP